MTLSLHTPSLRLLDGGRSRLRAVSSRLKIALVEVDCDLGAGTPGAGCGIELLKEAARRHHVLQRIHERLIMELAPHHRPSARTGSRRMSRIPTPHARHIHTISRVMADTASLVADSCRWGLFPVVLAGDHSTAAGTIAGLRLAHPNRRIGVVWIDAHADLHSPYTTPSGNMHGMPVAVAMGLDNHHHGINSPDVTTITLWGRCKALAGGSEGAAIHPRDLIYVSVRDMEAAEEATIRDHGISLIPTEAVRQRGPEWAAAHCLSHLAACDLIYVSFDVDSMDAGFCNGTGTPVPGGLWPAEASRLNGALLRDPRVCCWEICEINPHLDTLDTLTETTLGIYREVLEVLERRF